MICSGRDKIETPEQVHPLCPCFVVHTIVKIFSFKNTDVLCKCGQNITLLVVTLNILGLSSLSKLKIQPTNLNWMDLLLLEVMIQILMHASSQNTSGWCLRIQNHFAAPCVKLFVCYETRSVLSLQDLIILWPFLYMPP
jgi:hypothetical protein